MSLYTKIVRPIFFQMNPEFVHDITVFTGNLLGSNPITRNILRIFFGYNNPKLTQKINNITFPNPVGLAAGFDKSCKLMKVLPNCGFGFEEAGSITAEPYKGNPKPRATRLKADKGIIVYYGLKNKGAIKLRKKFLKNRHQKKFDIPIGISIAKTNKKHETLGDKIEDWVQGIELMKQCGDYLTINVSCPNTFDPQNFCDPNLLEILLDNLSRSVTFKKNKPIFLKLTADLEPSDLNRIIKICDANTRKNGEPLITGFILTNLVKDRSLIKIKSPKKLLKNPGGISGPLVKPRAMKLVKYLYKKAGDRYKIIACGGIFSAKDAYEYIKNGASLVQLITGMIYQGPGLIKRINKGLVKLLEKDGYKNISEAVGTNHK